MDAVREPIAVEQWKIVPPVTHSRQPLALRFPRPLDWALLSHTVTIASACGQSIDGQVEIDQCETRWSFIPASPWAVGSYHVCVEPSLEDVCGNSVTAAFDRPLRSGCDLTYKAAGRSIPFCLIVSPSDKSRHFNALGTRKSQHSRAYRAPHQGSTWTHTVSEQETAELNKETSAAVPGAGG